MRKVIVTEFLTLDGVMEEPTPWQRGFSSPEIGQFKSDELFESDALLLGRMTYEGFVKYWPTATGTGEFGERMNSLPKFVATTTLGSLQWNATALEGDVVAAVKALKRHKGRNLLGMNPPFRTRGQVTSPQSAGTLIAPRRSPDARTEPQPRIQA